MEFLSLSEVHQKTGVSLPTLRKEVRAGRLSAIESGAATLVSTTALDQWCSEHLSRVLGNRTNIGNRSRQRGGSRKASEAAK